MDHGGRQQQRKEEREARGGNGLLSILRRNLKVEGLTFDATNPANDPYSLDLANTSFKRTALFSVPGIKP